MKIGVPGIYADIKPSDYFADPCVTPSLTQSICKILLDQSPAHARLAHPRLCPPVLEEDEPERAPYSSAQAIGNAAHARLLGRGREIAVGEFKNWQTAAAKAFRDEAEASGKLIILLKHYDRALEMVGAAEDQLTVATHACAFNDGKGEVMLAWQEGDLWFRSLIDWMVHPALCYDLKSSGVSCAPHVVMERPSELGWDLQAAFHERGLDILDPTNAGRRQFYFVAIENTPPYGLSVVQISEHDLTMGRKKLAMAVDIWARCMATGQWPAYPAETVISRPRGYIETKWLEREIAHDERRTRREDLTIISAG